MAPLVFGMARSAEAACPPSAVELDDNVHTRWPGLGEEVRRALGSRDDLDRCERVTIAMRRGSKIHVEVFLGDGRTASRDVPHREDVVPMLEALLLVPRRVDSQPEPEPEPLTAEPAVQSAPLVTILPAPVPPVDADHVPSAPPADDDHLRIELGALTGARFGGGHQALGLGAHSFLELSGWLGGIEGRIDEYWSMRASRGTVAEFGLLAGRRVHFGDVALDVIGGPALVVLGAVSGDVAVKVNTFEATRMPDSGASTVTRLLVSTRLHFGARSTFRTFLGIDGEYGPEGPTDASPDRYRLPTWTLGLALGATVGTR